MRSDLSLRGATVMAPNSPFRSVWIYSDTASFPLEYINHVHFLSSAIACSCTTEWHHRRAECKNLRKKRVAT